jgi:DNA modification methylase
MVFRKPGARGTKNHVPEFLPDVWDIPLDKVKGYPNHDAFPTDLVRRVVARYTMSGDLVLDPFIGSGKTAVACLELGRRCVGFDTSSEAVLALRNRIGC